MLCAKKIFVSNNFNLSEATAKHNSQNLHTDIFQAC